MNETACLAVERILLALLGVIELWLRFHRADRIRHSVHVNDMITVRTIVQRSVQQVAVLAYVSALSSRQKIMPVPNGCAVRAFQSTVVAPPIPMTTRALVAEFPLAI